MSHQRPKVDLVFVNDFDELAAHEAQSRGYLSHVSVKLDDAFEYPVFFYNPVRLQQDLEEVTRLGRPFVADPGMIVIPEVTMEFMKAAVERLAEEGFFSHLQQIRVGSPGERGKSFNWPP
jgi:hypothetical protein